MTGSKGYDGTNVPEKEIQEPKLHFYLFVECCLHLTSIQNFWFLWKSVFLKQLVCGEWILSSAYGNVLSNLYLMSHC